jgi:SNF2 family DNA or RNA helicase
LKKIITYATFKKVHQPEEASQEDVASVDSDSDTDSETESDSDSEAESEDDADKNGDLRNFIVTDGVEDTEEEDDGGEDGNDEAEHAPEPKPKSKKRKRKRDQRRKSKGKKKEAKKHISLSMLKKEASRSAEGRRRYMKYLRKNWQPSAKVEKCVELLEGFQKDGEKTIIFSQFVSLLDLLQVPIDQKGWNCERYDGAMNADARNQAIVRFTEKQNTKIMLISLKAGNAGLNLVAASRVIILDPFWNPYIEMQAVDRAYRIGQQNSVQVHRILIKGTVEDRIIELQEKKRALVESALDEGASKSLGRLNVGQLAFLFGVGGSPE